MRSSRISILCAGILALIFSSIANAEEIRIAVAANFAEPAKEIAAGWEKKSGRHAILSFGATGLLFTQISQGAPFDIFLSADQATVEKASKEGFALAASQFTYAIGKLALYSKQKNIAANEQMLKESHFSKLAIANPDTAPYGLAAIETLKAMNLYDRLSSKLVQGQNIAQTFQFVETGNAELGFVALSQIIVTQEGSRWVVPEHLYTPIKQDAILLITAETNEAARDFLAYLKSPEANKIKEKYGYGF